MNGIKPQGKRILVKKFEAKETSSIIHVVEEHKEKPSEGIILEIGTEDTHLEVDDQVLFTKYAGHPINDDGSLSIMGYDDVIAVVNK